MNTLFKGSVTKFLFLKNLVIIFLFITCILSCNRIQDDGFFNSERADTIYLYSGSSIYSKKIFNNYLIILRRPNTTNFEIRCSNERNINKIQYFFIPLGESEYVDSIIFSSNDCCGMDSALKVIHWKNDVIFKEDLYSLKFNKIVESKEINEGIITLTLLYPNGTLNSVQKIINDSILEYKVWDENGKLYEEKTISNNRIFERSWYENRQLREEVVYDINTYQIIMSRAWCENGLLNDSALYNIGTFERKSYYCNGNMKEKWIYLNSPQYPFEIDEWYENGNRKFSGHFKKSLTPSIGGKPHGTWTFFDMNGKIERKEFYINGKLIHVKGKRRDKNK